MGSKKQFTIEIPAEQSPHPIPATEVEALLTEMESLDDVGEIELLQKKLHIDYKLLSKQLATARIQRVDVLIAKINDAQNQLRRDFHNYEATAQNEAPTSPGSTSAHKKNTKRDDLPQVPVSPELNELGVFPETFKLLVGNYQNELNTLRAKFDYEAKLIEDSSRGEVELIWQRYKQGAIRLRQEKRRELSKKRFELEADYLNLNKYAKLAEREQRYRRSVRKVAERKDKTMFQLTRAKVLERVKIPRITDDIGLLNGASDVEISNDLAYLRSTDPESVQIHIEEANHKYMEQPLKKSSSLVDGVPPTMTDLVNAQLENGNTSHQQLNGNKNNDLGMEPYYYQPMYQQDQRHPPPPYQHQHPVYMQYQQGPSATQQPFQQHQQQQNPINQQPQQFFFAPLPPPPPPAAQLQSTLPPPLGRNNILPTPNGVGANTLWRNPGVGTEGVSPTRSATSRGPPGRRVDETPFKFR